MGALVSRWRKKPTTVEQLEALDKEIKGCERSRAQNLQTQRQLIGYLIVWSIVLYVFIALLYLLVYFPPEWIDRIVYSLPFFAFPGLIWLLKKFLHWYFLQRTVRTDGTLRELRTKKKDILEEVMEKEVYKKAKEILEKYDPERFKQIEKPHLTPIASQLRTPGTETRQRSPNGQPSSANQSFATPHLPRPVAGTNQRQMFPPSTTQRNGRPSPQSFTPGFSHPPPGPPMARAILPRERTTAEKLVEYLVGDGPQNRYALICRQCLSHNGMALKEEFEYLSFRCCYCYTINPARKNRPFAPRLEPATFPSHLGAEREGSTESESGSTGSPEETMEVADVYEDDIIENSYPQPMTVDDIGNEESARPSSSSSASPDKSQHDKKSD